VIIAAGIIAGSVTFALFWITERAFKATVEESFERDRLRVLGPSGLRKVIRQEDGKALMYED